MSTVGVRLSTPNHLSEGLILNGMSYSSSPCLLKKIRLKSHKIKEAHAIRAIIDTEQLKSVFIMAGDHSERNLPLNILKKPYWSPYLSGVLIGLLQIPIFLLLHASLGASGSFHSAACSLLSFLSGNGDTIASQCFPALKSWWQLGFVVGIMMGAYISSRLSHTQRKNVAPVWKKAANVSSFWIRALMAFLGGFIMLIGARLADGCTSGNGVSGIALLSIGSMIVIVSMFVGGVLFVRLYKKI